MSTPPPGTFELEASDGAARAGVLWTAHGPVRTPVFMPVGTKATVKALDPLELEALGAQIVLGNTYHLHLRPGEELIAELGGLHRFMAWDRPILTDSGGYQVFSLLDTARIDADGVTFRSVYDGTEERLTPERAMAIQAALSRRSSMSMPPCTIPNKALPESKASLDLLAQRIESRSESAACSSLAG